MEYKKKIILIKKLKDRKEEKEIKNRWETNKNQDGRPKHDYISNYNKCCISLLALP